MSKNITIEKWFEKSGAILLLSQQNINLILVMNRQDQIPQGRQSFTFLLRGDGTLADHDCKSGNDPVSAIKFSPFSFGILFQLN